MEQRIVDAIRELEQLDKQTNAPEPLYRISADNGQFLNLLVRVSGAKRVLEIGSSSGYSGLYLGEAARANGGTVTTCELSEYKIQLAKSVYEKAGLSNTISIVEGDALETLKTLQGPWDFVFIDAWKEDYPAYLHLVWPHVKQGGAVVADDIISAGDSPGIKRYLEDIRAKSDARTVTVPVDDGVDVSQVQVRKDKTTGVAFVTYFENGERKFLFHIADAAAAADSGRAIRRQLA